MRNRRHHSAPWLGAMPLVLSVAFALMVSMSGTSAAHAGSVGASPGGEVSEIIVVPGSGFSGISPGFSGDCRWSSDGSVIWTYWDRGDCEANSGVSPWVEYTVNLGPGLWRIGLDAINHANPGQMGLGEDPSWYPQFEVGNSLTPDIIAIPASDTEVNQGYTEYEVLTGGSYTVRYWWLNDATVGELPDGLPELDANIKIVDAFFARVTTLVPTDIKPGSDTNPVNLMSGGVIPVAILTTEDFDATAVDPLSVAFGLAGASEAHGRGHFSDVDYDGDIDLMLHFRTQETGIQPGDTEACLVAQTFEGQAIVGCDFIATG